MKYILSILLSITFISSVEAGPLARLFSKLRPNVSRGCNCANCSVVQAQPVSEPMYTIRYECNGSSCRPVRVLR
jgi:hypothetical protein